MCWTTLNVVLPVPKTRAGKEAKGGLFANFIRRSPPSSLTRLSLQTSRVRDEGADLVEGSGPRSPRTSPHEARSCSCSLRCPIIKQRGSQATGAIHTGRLGEPGIPLLGTIQRSRGARAIGAGPRHALTDGPRAIKVCSRLNVWSTGAAHAIWGEVIAKR